MYGTIRVHWEDFNKVSTLLISNTGIQRVARISKALGGGWWIEYRYFFLCFSYWKIVNKEESLKKAKQYVCNSLDVIF